MKRRRGRRRLGRPAAHRRLRRAPTGTSSSGSPGLEEDVRTELAASHGIEHDVARWEDLLDARRPGRGQRRGADLPARADRGRRARARHPRALARSRSRAAASEADAMVQAARKAGRVLDVAFNHRQRGDIQRAQGGHRRRAAGTAVLREGVVASPHGDTDRRQLVHAGRAGGRRTAGRHRRARPGLLAVPAREPHRAGGQRVDLRPAGQRRLRVERPDLARAG